MNAIIRYCVPLISAAAESPRSAAETEALAQLKACDPQTLTARQAQQLLYTLTDLLH